MTKAILFDVEKSRTFLGELCQQQANGWPLLFCALAERASALAVKGHGRAITGVRMGAFTTGPRVLFIADPANRAASKSIRVIEIATAQEGGTVIAPGGEIEPNEMTNDAIRDSIPANQKMHDPIDAARLIETVQMRLRRRKSSDTVVHDPIIYPSYLILEKYLGEKLRGLDEELVQPLTVAIGHINPAAAAVLPQTINVMWRAARKEIQAARAEVEAHA